MQHLVKNRVKFLDMYQKLLEVTVGGSATEACLIDTFEYIRLSVDDILRLDEHVEDPEYVDHPLDTISLGILEARSFLFNYEKPSDKSKESSTKLQRSQSERRVKKSLDPLRLSDRPSLPFPKDPKSRNRNLSPKIPSCLRTASFSSPSRR